MKEILTVVAIVAMNAVLSVGVMLQIRTDENNRAYVTAICEQSHISMSGQLEDRCGQAQDKTHTEFLCTERTTESLCWTEVK